MAHKATHTARLSSLLKPLRIGTSSARESTHSCGPHGSASGPRIGQPEHQLSRLNTRLLPDGDNPTTRSFPRPVRARVDDIARFHKRSRHAQGTTPEDHTTEIASDQVLYGAGDGNRTRVSSLGSASRLIPSCLRVGCLARSRSGSGSPSVVRCCAVLHPVVRSSRHELGTPTACSVGAQ
jgi:hypothetical protein